MVRMKKYLIVVLVLGMTQILIGQVSLNIYHSDGETPFDCNNGVMLGESIKFVISSDSNEYWSGGLFISGQDRTLGTLVGRDLDPNTRDWTGSHFQAAGNSAKVTEWKDSAIFGFDFYTFYPKDPNSDPNSTATGDWFVIDYYADNIGDCNIGFYLYDHNANWHEPNYVITVHNVPTRNFNTDEQVDLLDYSVLASFWMATSCSGPNWCGGTDLNFDGYVDSYDLGLFAEYWCWGTSTPSVAEVGQMMGGEGSEMQMMMMQTQSAVSASTSPTQAKSDKIIGWLENLWVEDEEVRATISEEEWNGFIESVKYLAEY